MHHSFPGGPAGVRLAFTRRVDPALGRAILLSAAVVVAALLLRALVGWLVRRAAGQGALHRDGASLRFGIVQGTRIVLLIAAVVALAVLWFGDSSRLAAVAGIVTAGIAVALQRVITSFAAYLIVLRGRVYTIGDRITLGGVRGDVVAIGFMQTTVMEMGAPVPNQNGDLQSWVAARQYTGRMVSVTNDKIFDTPVYNYTREFPYLWDEMTFPVKYGADRQRAESILLTAARHQTDAHVAQAQPALQKLRERYLLGDEVSLEPRVFLRLTDNWIELALRFLAPVHGVRAIKDAIGREVIAAFDEAHLEIASATYDIIGLPTVRVMSSPPAE